MSRQGLFQQFHYYLDPLLALTDNFYDDHHVSEDDVIWPQIFTKTCRSQTTPTSCGKGIKTDGDNIRWRFHGIEEKCSFHTTKPHWTGTIYTNVASLVERVFHLMSTFFRAVYPPTSNSYIFYIMEPFVFPFASSTPREGLYVLDRAEHASFQNFEWPHRCPSKWASKKAKTSQTERLVR